MSSKPVKVNDELKVKQTLNNDERKKLIKPSMRFSGLRTDEERLSK
jgi:hypothetical protein